MSTPKRDAAAAELDKGASEEPDSSSNQEESTATKHLQFALDTFECILSLCKTPYLDLVGSEFLNICIILRLIITAHQNGANLFHGEVSCLLVSHHLWSRTPHVGRFFSNSRICV